MVHVQSVTYTVENLAKQHIDTFFLITFSLLNHNQYVSCITRHEHLHFHINQQARILTLCTKTTVC